MGPSDLVADLALFLQCFLPRALESFFSFSMRGCRVFFLPPGNWKRLKRLTVFCVR